MSNDKNNKKSKILEKLSSKRAVRIFWLLIASPFAVLFLLLGLTAAGVFGKLPTFEELENPKSNISTEIYSDDGQMIGSFFVQNRSFVDYSELNDSLVAALISTEDIRYYSHSGIDFQSLGRVAIKTVLMGGKQGGGSTITQQLAKNLFPRDTTIYTNKFSRYATIGKAKLKEWITAVKLESNYTKEEIIAMYFNTVEYGSNAYGIKSAAQTFFQKAPADLTINEAAMMVGVVNAPTMYSPVRNPENALRRRNTVLARMVDSGFITQTECDSLSQIPIKLNFKPVTHNEGHGTYFRGMLSSVMTMSKPKRNQYNSDWDYNAALKLWEENPLYGWCHKNLKADGTPYNIYRDGLKIYTTINSSMQKYAEQAVQERMEKEIQPAMDAQIKQTKRVFYKQSQEDIDNIIRRAMRYSDRYRHMKNSGASDKAIDEAFNTPVKMKIFTYKGDADTTMTPRDSIIHHKSILRASFMAMDPHTGYVKAYVGGPSYRYFKYDMVKQGKRQVGSTIKPFIYGFGIDHLGFTPCTMVQNVDVVIETENGTPWQPKEAGNTEKLRDGEYKPLWWGLANSRNNYSAWIMKQSKQPSAVADFIHKMGVSSYIDPVYALCLGTSEVSLYEMVGAYSTYVNQGVHTDPIFVTRIEDRHGNLLATFTPTTSDVISPQTAYTMVGMLKNVVQAGTAGRLRYQWGFTGELGGKTGTTDENRDAWYMGIAPKLVAGVWVGGEDQSVHLLYRGEGSALAMPIYAEFLKRVYADPRLGITQNDTFSVPDGAVTYNCSKTGNGPDGEDEDPTVSEFFD